LALLIATASGEAVWAQQARLRQVNPVAMPAPVDSNSPAFRDSGGQFHLFNSTVTGPIESSGANQFALNAPQPVKMNTISPWAYWIESVWRDPNGLVYGWYHQEFGPCPEGNYLAVPRIGAAISYDGGVTFLDMGSIITSGEPTDCSSQNGYVAGGVGDFSVILDQEHKYFYFLYSSYGGSPENEGISIARMPYESRLFPNGAVLKYYSGSWSEPGLDGRDFAVFPAKVAWQLQNTDSMWGPSVHWNTYLKKFVVLMNHSCCSPRYPQDGIFISYNADLSDPQGFTNPVRLLNDPGWYPQVIGAGPNGSDTLAGQAAQLYVAGKSRWQIVFQ
jgi:hypothetical protein